VLAIPIPIFFAGLVFSGQLLLDPGVERTGRKTGGGDQEGHQQDGDTENHAGLLVMNGVARRWKEKARAGHGVTGERA
jgi:hypothetical protein